MSVLHRVAKKCLPVTAKHYIKIMRQHILKGHLFRTITVRRYLRQTPIPKLQVGCGSNSLKGWLNADIVSGDIYLNATKRMPFNDRTFDFIFCEHFIEHISLGDSFNFLKECLRILKINGIIRITTPDLEKLIEIYFDTNKFARREDFIRITSDKIRISPCELFNRYFGQDHKFIYDKTFIQSVLLKIGFANSTFCSCHESNHAELVNVERHISEHEWLNPAETLTIEAERL
jgi:SAM-dependent methyltransferase